MSGRRSSPAPSRNALRVALEREPGSAYLLSLDLRICYVNQGWCRFARESGAPELADDYLSFGPVSDTAEEGPMRDFYLAGFARVLARGEPWNHLYECSSAETYRKTNMRVTLTPDRDGFVVVNSTVMELPLRQTSVGVTDLHPYTGDRGILVQCANCRRVRRGDRSDTWDWVPQTLSLRQKNLSHGLCHTCEVLYYSTDQALSQRFTTK